MSKNSEKKRLKLKIGLAVVILLFSVFIYFANWWSDFRGIFTLNKINVNGCFVMDETEIKQSINKFVKGRNIKNIKVKAIQSHLQNMPYIKAANVIRDYPDKLNIVIFERVPLLYFIANNKTFILDRNGILLPVPNNSLNKPLPLLTGFSLSKRIEKGETIENEKSKESVRLFYKLKENSSNVFNRISELHFRKSKDDYIMYLETNTKIYLGKENLEGRMETLIHFIRQLPEQIGLSRYDYIDLRWKDQVVVKEDI